MNCAYISKMEACKLIIPTFMVYIYELIYIISTSELKFK